MRPAVLRRAARSGLRSFHSSAQAQRRGANEDRPRTEDTALVNLWGELAKRGNPTPLASGEPTDSQTPMGASQRKSNRPVIKYESGTAGESLERLAFFADGEETGGFVEAADDVPGIEAGKVVEIRR